MFSYSAVHDVAGVGKLADSGCIAGCILCYAKLEKEKQVGERWRENWAVVKVVSLREVERGA